MLNSGQRRLTTTTPGTSPPPLTSKTQLTKIPGKTPGKEEVGKAEQAPYLQVVRC
jgi:hypothetical protein